LAPVMEAELADPSKAKVAYLLAVERIEQVVARGDLEMHLIGADFEELEAIPTQIERARQVTTLHISCPKVTDISALSHLTKLTNLVIESSGITDISALSGLHALNSLSLASTGLRDIAALGFLTRLEHLSLEGTGVEDISPLAPLRRSLRYLNLNHTEVSDLSPLALHKGLLNLSLKATPVTDLAPLSMMTALATFDISETPVSDISIAAGLPGLRNLDLTGSRVADMRPLAHHADLGDGNDVGFQYDSTPAVEADATLARLAKISDNRERTRKTLEYLQSFPLTPKTLVRTATGQINPIEVPLVS
jgi:Leucine-rich repeat (LRR) protein